MPYLLRNIVVLLLLITGSTFSADESFVCSVYSETTYAVGKAGKITGHLQIISQGSGYQILADGVRYVVTASHVATGPDLSNSKWTAFDPDTHRTVTYTFGPHDYAVMGIESRIRIGYLSIPPHAILIDRKCDVAIMSLWPEHYVSVPTTTFMFNSTCLPVLNEPVLAWGFPGTAIPQVTDPMTVNAVNLSTISVNKEIADGYSGGPVVSSNCKVLYGTLLSGSQKQAYLAPNSVTAGVLARFSTEAAKINGTYKVSLIP